MAVLPWNAPNLLKPTTPAQNAQNIRATGATTGEAARFARVAPPTTITKSPALTPQQTMNILSNTVTVPKNAQGPLKTGYVTANKAASTVQEQTRNIAAANAAARQTGTTATGAIVATPPGTGATPAPAPAQTPAQAPAPGGANGSASGGNAPEGSSGGTVEEGTTPEEQKVDAAAMLAALINQLLEGDFIGFQGQRAAELRRLQNLRNQLYGDVEMGSTGAVQRQQQLDANARRRLAAGRAVSGMLAGGAYAGTERGLGTIQRAEQDFALQELQRPFREQTASDRLAEFGLSFTPQGRQFNLSDFGSPEDMLAGWARSTFGGREAAARARQAAIQQLAQRGIQI